MTARKLVIAAFLAAVATPATASVMVVGSSTAQACYQAADSQAAPTAADFANCDSALREGGLTRQDMAATHVNRGVLRLRRNEVQPALADFDTAISIDPTQAEAYLNKGAALMRVDNARDALPLFTASLQRNTRRPDLAHYARGVANETLGNVRAAYEDYRRASQLRPDWQEPLVELQRFRVVQ